MAKLPAIMFYPGDWLSDEIAGCSLAAQGLWLRMMFLMHRSSRYGHLALPNGSAIPPTSVAAQCGISQEAYETLLLELDSVGKISRNNEGVIFSRRMVRDWQKRAADRGRKRKERSIKRDVTPGVTPVVTPNVTRPVTDLSGGISIAVSVSKEQKQKRSRDKREGPLHAASPGSKHAVFRGLIEEAWNFRNDIAMPWDGGEGAQLAALIAANPNLGPEGLRKLLKHRNESAGVNFAERPRAWLSDVTRYARGPLDRFGAPIEEARAAAKAPVMIYAEVDD